MTLDINPEIICSIADKARQFHVKVPVEIPETPLEHADYTLLQILVDYKDDPTFLELKAMINDLEPDQQEDLVAIMWIGRGDFTVEEWNEAKEQARSSRSLPVANYLIATPLLADYLEEGLSKLGYSCES